MSLFSLLFYFFFNDTATTEIYTLSLHDALPISSPSIAISRCVAGIQGGDRCAAGAVRISLQRHHQRSHEIRTAPAADRKSTRLNSSHSSISYAVFCLKKKKNYNAKLFRATDCTS